MATHTSTLTRLFGNDKKAVAINLSLVANAFIWYSYSFNYLRIALDAQGLLNQYLGTIGVHFACLFVALIIGQIVSNRMKDRSTFLKWWTIAGIPLSLLIILTGMNLEGIMIFAAIAGVNFGFGIPVCLGHFAANTEPSHRAKIGGIMFLIIGAGGLILSMIGTGNVITAALILATWRIIGYLSIVKIKPEERNLKQPQISYKQVISNRSFVLYYVPWVMFLLVNSLAFPVIESKLVNTNILSAELVQDSSRIEFVLAGISAAFVGFFADSKGRKRLAVAGFALLGLAYAILGFTSGTLTGWWVYTLIDGTAWGILAMIFVFTIWGDLAEGRKSEKIYALGLMPYLLSTFLRYAAGSAVANAINDFAMIFSFFSFFLFIAVLPLVFAPETMSEQIIKQNELKSYVEKAKKQVAKVEKKQEDPPKPEAPAPNENAEESDEYKKAKELAEKYY